MTPAPAPDDRVVRMAWIALATSLCAVLAVRGDRLRLPRTWGDTHALRAHASELERRRDAILEAQRYWEGTARALAAGDEFLREAAARARGFLRPGEFDARRPAGDTTPQGGVASTR